MIIVSQDQKQMINFDNIEIIFLKQQEIWYQGVYGEGYQLAEYKTEERAIEVLQEITKAYTCMELINTRQLQINSEIQGKDLAECICYKMPEE